MLLKFIYVVISFMGCFVLQLLSVFRSPSFLAFVALRYRQLQRKWQPIISIYSSYCIIFCRPIMSHLHSTAPNKAREQPLLLIQKYKSFPLLTCKTPTRFHLERKGFRIFSKFQGHKLTFIPLL